MWTSPPVGIYRYPLYTGIPAPVAGFDKPESRSQAVGFRSLALPGDPGKWHPARQKS